MSWSSNWIEADILREQFINRLNQIKTKQVPANEQGKTECCHSAICCWRRPGELEEADIKPLADHLGVTKQQLFQQYLVVDKWGDDLKLVPRRKHQTGGVMLDWRETYSLESPCVFLTDQNKCAVHEVKPVACRNFKCWEKQDKMEYGVSKAKLLELGWDGQEEEVNCDE